MDSERISAIFLRTSSKRSARSSPRGGAAGPLGGLRGPGAGPAGVRLSA